MKIEFTILGEPQGKGRPRFSRRGEKVVTTTPDATVLYENLVKTEYERQCGTLRFPDGAALKMDVYAYYAIPLSSSKTKRNAMLAGQLHPTKKPDFDNVGKVIADSLNSIAYRDDAQITDGRVRKFYSDRPRVVVMIRTVDE